jgi:hypothetical protein
MTAYDMHLQATKLWNEASQIIDRALYLGSLGDLDSYTELMAEANDLNAQATELDHQANDLYRHEWTPEVCACVTPEQSCPACRAEAAKTYSEMPY